MKNWLLSILAVACFVFLNESEARGQAQSTRTHERSLRRIGPERTLPAQPDRIPGLSPRERSILSKDTVSLPFFDDMENGENGWTHTGFEHLITDPQRLHVLNPTINPNLVVLPDAGQLPSAFSGHSAWWYGEDSTGTFIGTDFGQVVQSPLGGGTSNGPNTGSLISPPLDLRNVSRVTMRFETWWEIEGVNSDFFDEMYVEASTNGGETWLPAGDRGKINPLNNPQGESWKAYTSGGLGVPGVWVRQVFDLTQYAGSVTLIRFRFDTRDDLYNGFRGWFIDDVSISASPLPAPKITGIVPKATSGDGLVNILGSNFVNGAVVHIGTDSVSSSVISDSVIMFQVPFLSPGTYDVTVTNPDSQSVTLAGGLSVTTAQPPIIDFIVPDSAEWGKPVSATLSGSGFMTGATVEIGGLPATNVVIVDPTEITATTPLALPVGNHNVRVTNPDGQFDQLISGFRVTPAGPPPHIVSLTPDSTQAGKQVNVTITGRSFQAGAIADIGGFPLDSSVVDSTKITGKSPKILLPGSYDVKVTNPDGQFDQRIAGFRVTPGVTIPIIAVTVGPGFIVPKDTVLVLQGTDQTFTITVVPGAKVDSVVVDGVNQGPVQSYTFTNVTLPHLIVVYFSPVSGFSVSPPDTVLLGNNTTISITLPSSFQPTTKELYYRNGGQTTYQVVTLTGSGTSLAGAIPPAAVNFRGVEYYVRVADASTTYTFPPVSPDIFPAIMQVDVQRALMPVALPARQYRMVSVPLELKDTTLVGLFTDDFGQPDPTRWRVFRWEDTSNVEFPAIRTGVLPGKAFWLITSGGNAFDVRGGKSLISSDAYVVKLRPGWNQFADPFAFPVSWNSIASSAPPGKLRGPYRYDGTQYSIDTTVVLPWEGYFVLNTDSLQDVQVSVPPVEALIIPKSAYRNTVATAGDYFVQLSARVPGSDLHDTQNFLGFRPTAAEGTDSFDYPKPPPIGECVQLAIMDHGKAYMENFKPAGTEGQDWDVRLESTSKLPVVVSVGTLGSLPQGFGLYLLDLDNQNTVVLDNNTFHVSMSAPNAVRSFRVILGTEAYAENRSKGIPLVPLAFALEQNFPNPFNPETTIRYQLAKRSTVTMEIFNVLGQRVRTLVNDVQSTGSYSVTWNARSDDGRPVASGVYVCRLHADEATAVRKLVLVR